MLSGEKCALVVYYYPVVTCSVHRQARRADARERTVGVDASAAASADSRTQFAFVDVATHFADGLPNTRTGKKRQNRNFTATDGNRGGLWFQWWWGRRLSPVQNSRIGPSEKCKKRSFTVSIRNVCTFRRAKSLKKPKMRTRNEKKNSRRTCVAFKTLGKKSIFRVNRVHLKTRKP